MKQRSIRNLRLLGRIEPARDPVSIPGRLVQGAGPAQPGRPREVSAPSNIWGRLFIRLRGLKKRHLFLLAGYTAYCLALLLIFGYLTFPFERLQLWLISELQQATGVAVQVEEFERSFPLKMAWRGVSIRPPSGLKEPVTLDIARARLYVFPLLRRRFEADLFVEAYGGWLRGSLAVEKKESSRRFYVQQSAQDIDLGRVGFDLPYALKGSASVNLEAKWEDRGLFAGSGTSTVEWRGAELSGLVLNGMEVPPLDFSRVVAKMSLGNGVVRIDDFRAQGGQIEATGRGTIVPRDRLEDGLLNLSMNARVLDDFREQFPMIAMLGSRLDAIQIIIKGTLRRPLISVNGMPINL